MAACASLLYNKSQLTNDSALFVRILQSSAAYVPLDPESPGLLSARVMNQCGLEYCAVQTDLLQVEFCHILSALIRQL